MLMRFQTLVRTLRKLGETDIGPGFMDRFHKAADPPMSLVNVLNEEFLGINGTPMGNELEDRICKAHNQQSWALCLSGGGIRSATFSLGALQGLARAGLLECFDYLSTV